MPSVCPETGIPTCDRTEQSQCGSVPAVLVDHPLPSRHRDRDGEADRLVELPPAGLDGDDRRHRHSVTEQLGRQLGGDWLGLEMMRKINKMKINKKFKINKT